MTKPNWEEQFRSKFIVVIQNQQEQSDADDEAIKFISNLLIQEREVPKREYCKRCNKWLLLHPNNIRTETIKEVIEMIDKTFETGHGGGNWRRLVEQLKGELEKL